MQKAITKMACIWIPKIQNPHGFKKIFAEKHMDSRNSECLTKNYHMDSNFFRIRVAFDDLWLFGKKLSWILRFLDKKRHFVHMNAKSFWILPKGAFCPYK
jgi:hypothetical protein